MHASSGGTITSIAYVVMLAASIASTQSALGGVARWLWAPRVTAMMVWAVVAVPSMIELAYDPIFDALSRQPAKIRGEGQLWRLATSVVVQDGGVGGTIFNLVSLAIIVTLTVHLWGRARAVGLFIAGALAFNVMTTYVSPSPGGGNSGATFFLATSMVGLLVVRRWSRPVVLAATIAAAIGVGLLIARDAHGEPILGGLVIGAALAAVTAPRQLPTPNL